MTSRLTYHHGDTCFNEDISETLSLGWQLLHRHQLDHAEMLCNKLVTAHPDHAETLFLYGMTQWKSGKPADAIPLFKTSHSAPTTASSSAQCHWPHFQRHEPIFGSDCSFSKGAKHLFGLYGRSLQLRFILLLFGPIFTCRRMF